MIPKADAARLGDWYACLSEAFDLAAVPQHTDMAAPAELREPELSEDAARDFQKRFGALVEKAAKIVIPLERKWRHLGRISKPIKGSPESNPSPQRS